MALKEKLAPLADKLSLYGEALSLRINIAVHPNSSGKIMVIYPGWGSSIDGTGGKYKRLAPYVQTSGLAAVVRLENKDPSVYNLLRMVGSIIKSSQAICGSPTPEIFLMGSCVGAGAIALVATNFEQVRKILLVSPWGADAAPDYFITEHLRSFRGEISVVMAKNDNKGVKEFGKLLLVSATNASRRNLKFVPNCDHIFTGKEGEKILKKVVVWAFGEQKRLDI